MHKAAASEPSLLWLCGLSFSVAAALSPSLPTQSPTAAAEAVVTLRSAALRVALDLQLPRPTSITHLWTSTDFSPPATAPAGDSPGPPPASHWWQRVANQALLDVAGGETCTAAAASSHCHALPHSFPKGQGTAKCEAACDASATCVAWNLLKDTPRSGQHGKGDLCLLFAQGGLAKSGPHYAPDPNFDCGSKAQLQPTPPAHAAGGAGAAQPATACVGIVAANGTETRFCGSEASTVYSARTSNATTDAVRWRLTLAKPGGGVTVTLAGTVSVETDPAVSSLSTLSWSLLSAESEQVIVRAVDLGFAFVGVSGHGDQYYYTHSTKTWCPPGVGCGEWSTSTAMGTVGVQEPSLRSGSVSHDGWTPPGGIPWAAKALLDPARSNGVGAWTADGAAGVGAYSSQLTLPFRRYQNGTTASIGLGSARINTRLRCGDVLPVTLKWGVFSDLTTDGKVNADDCTVWTRSNYPVADFIFRGSMTIKIDNDISSYLLPWNPSKDRVSFNQTLEYVKAIAALSDNMPTVLHLVGWGGTGLDTGIYNEINARLGTLEDLVRLKETAARDYNTIISYHIDTDNAYPNLTACSEATAAGDWTSTSGHPVAGTKDGLPTPGFNSSMLSLDPNGSFWVWDATSGVMRTDPLQGACYHISKTKDTVSGGRAQRFDEMYNTVPMADVLHMDAYRDIDVSWETDERGFIAEDEEAACGLAFDLTWLSDRNMSLGVEGSNGMASVGGPNSPAMNVFDYYWHGHWTLGEWGRIVSGTDQGLDTDMPYAHTGCWTKPSCDCSNWKCTGSAATDPFGNWESLADRVYLEAKVLALKLTDTELHGVDSASGEMRFSNGGTSRRWPHGVSIIEYFRPGRPAVGGSDGLLNTDATIGAAVFVPEVVLPPPGSPKTAPTKVNPNRVYVYLHSGAGAAQRQTWPIPASWVGKPINATTITPTGRIDGQPGLSVNEQNLTLEVTPGRPVVLSV